MQTLWEMVCMFLKKLEIELPYDLAIPLLGIYSKEMQALCLKRYLYSYIHCSIICNSQHVETTLVSIDVWMVKESAYAYVCVCDGILLSHKKGKLPFVTILMDFEGIMLMKQDRERQISWAHIGGI